ncbi:hypothetical protein SAY87_026139 [Trapa incisa]|uniref:PB1 domain-containing protein n=1 Tax=Trapa incisa TaxID=236973 RepID=A0AAN7H251_9MYRT|nr:hypothetical protein SAY87_026139 [Trapa incisa]
MGKPAGKKKEQRPEVSQKPGDSPGKSNKPSKASFDEDTTLFISMSQELKEEGNRLFQKHDHEGAMLKYEKALKLLPSNHIDVAYLRSNMAACYMQLGLGEYPRAINECNLALEVSPRYSKAFLKRAKCYEALNRLDLALRDVNNVLSMEPSNLTARGIAASVKRTMSEKGMLVEDKEVVLESTGQLPVRKLAKEKSKKRSGGKGEERKIKDQVITGEKKNVLKLKEVILKAVEEEKEMANLAKEENVVSARTVKLVLGEDIRWAKLPANCTIRMVRKIVMDRFPCLNGVLIKYKDQEGDLVTFTTTNELRMAEAVSIHNGPLKFYITEVEPEKEPFYEGLQGEEEIYNKSGNDAVKNGDLEEEEKEEKNTNKGTEKGPTSIEDWILQFACVFKNHVGFDSDSYLELHELGMKLYSEAMEDRVTAEYAQQLFEIASDKFQEMAALALLNWGHVHLSQARKQVFVPENSSPEMVLEKVKAAYEWSSKEYVMAASRYEEALKIKPDFYEALLAIGRQQFEQAKLCWYYAIGTKIELNDGLAVEGGPASEVLTMYNKAEDNMERGMQMWEEMEESRLNGLLTSEKYRDQLEKMGLDGFLKDISTDEEATEQASNMRSQIYLLWGTLLYERSVVEYRLELPTWEECLEVAVEKFELAGASQTDIAVMIKNHCSNETAIGGFKIDEIVHAWYEMYDARRWEIGVPSFRLEPLFRRQVPKLHSTLEHI